MPYTKAISLVKQFEGFQAQPYLCPAECWTIGYGHTHGVTEETPAVNEAQAETLLRADLSAADTVITHAVHTPLNNNQRAALLSFIFNLGAPRFLTSTLLRKLNAGDIAGAADEFPRWVNAGGVPLPGLIARRAAERELFLNGG